MRSPNDAAAPAAPAMPAAPSTTAAPAAAEPDAFRRATDAPAAVRVFSWALFLRAPLATEVPEIAAALALMKRRAGWLAAGYAVFIGLLAVPGLLRDRSLAYHLAAVVGPHVLLWMLLMSVAYAWIGFRMTLSNMRTWLPKVRRERSRRVMVAFALVSAVAGVFVGYTAGRVIFHGERSPLAIATSEAAAWVSDTFDARWVMLLFIVLLVAVPELVAQLRLREHALAERVHAAEAARERLARQTAESELRLLQGQVEPHFLYNTLANVRYLVRSGSPDALRLTDALIAYLRTSVPDLRAARVTLGREAEHVRHYLEIMRFRMPGRLDFAIDIAPAVHDVPVPPLVLLTLVENAVKHGLTPLVEGGRVDVHAAPAGDGAVCIEVRDTGTGLPAAAAAGDAAGGPGADAGGSTGTGLANTRSRLQLAYGGAARLDLLPNSPRGTVARVQLPSAPPPAPDDVPRVVTMSAEAWAALNRPR